MKDYLVRRVEELTDKETLAEVYFAASEKLGYELRTDNRNIEAVLIGEYQEYIEERYRNWGKMVGLSTGYPSIDKLTMGLVGGEMIIIAGRTSMGKTALALGIAEKLATDHLVYFVTLEMTKVELGSRLQHIHSGPVTDLNLLVQKNDDLRWQDIGNLLKYAKESGVELVVIDHLHYFTRVLDNVAEDLGRVTKEIKQHAIRYDIPVILLSHVRKGQGGSATIEDLRGSSYIAQDADIVLMVERENDFEDVINVTIEKNRNRGYDFNENKVTLQFDATKITEPTEVLIQPTM